MPGPWAIIFDLGGTLWHWPRKDPTRDGAWFWSRAYGHTVQTLPHLGREAFAAVMVAAEDDYRRRADRAGSGALYT